MITASQFYKSIFDCKIYKVSISAGCTCPNRDGTKSTGGCIFCSEKGSGDFATSAKLSIKEQVESGKKLVQHKNKGGKYIAYFQNFTNSYGDAQKLIDKYQEALEQPDVVGISIATRPDCLQPQILQYLSKISQSTFVQVELGLQTSNPITGQLINRCYTNQDFISAVESIHQSAPNIHIVTHIIFGLPGETQTNMLDSIKFAVEHQTNGIKISCLHVLKNTKLAEMYNQGKFQVLEMNQYFDILEKALKLIPPQTIIHRLTGDGPKSQLIAPLWTANKKLVLSELNKLLKS